jgi:hypothetical protein
MAGEWIAYDLALPDKPEVQELIDLTGEPVEAVVFNLLRLWGWASMHCADGTARMTLPRLVRTCGANETFWRAVASVGWLEIDETVATVAVPGWDRRFSQAAKSRIQARDREKAYDERSGRPSQRERGRSPAPARGDEPAPARGRGEEIRGEYPPPPPPPADAWGTLRAAWNRGTGRPWKPADPPEGLADRLAEAGWLDEALDAIPRLSACRFFKTPPTLLQFVKPGFVRRVMGGQYDDAQAAKATRGQPSDVPIRVWSGDDAARLEATKRAMASKIRENA